jgi:hypothetical protein
MEINNLQTQIKRLAWPLLYLNTLTQIQQQKLKWLIERAV